jgi:hypothetical protein
MAIVVNNIKNVKFYLESNELDASEAIARKQVEFLFDQEDSGTIDQNVRN